MGASVLVREGGLKKIVRWGVCGNPGGRIFQKLSYLVGGGGWGLGGTKNLARKRG